MNTQPVLLKPAFKDYLWGGTKLRTEYKKECDLNPIAESWELSAHKDGQSVIASGADSGLTISEYIEKNGKEILGKNSESFDRFPILIKFIDAKQDLSIQVHPSDEYALEHEGEYGKTEVWYIMSAEEGSSLYYGTNTEIDRDEFRKRIEENTITEVLNRVEAKKGDVFFIEPGTIHAIGAGLMICEIQQNSNTTYRVYDYDRRDANGNPRELHIEKAIEVSELRPPEKENISEENVLAKCKYFTVEKYVVNDCLEINVSDDCFKSIINLSGSGKLEYDGGVIEFSKGESIFIPAQNTNMKIIGECEIIVSYV